MHKDKEAVGFCAECGRGVCAECAVELNGTQYCQECKNKIESTPKDEYIICESCGGQYKLEEGESLEDFDACECGGKLKSDQIIEETKGKSNLHEIADKLDPETVQKAKDKSKGFLEEFLHIMDWLAVSVGIIVVIVLSILYEFVTSFGNQNVIMTLGFVINSWVTILLALLSGFLAGYISARNPIIGKNLKTGIANGAITSFIATALGLITIFCLMGIFYNQDPILLSLIEGIDYFFKNTWSWTYVILTIIVGAIGGFVGTFTRINSKGTTNSL